MMSTNENGCRAVGFLEERYVLGEMLGEGSMGRVFAAHDNVLGIDVAVKMMHEELVKSRWHVQRFSSEASIAAHILSTHAVKSLGLAVTREGVPCIIYEHLDGETLRERIQRCGGISLAETADIVQQTSHALARAHAIGVIHRDVKPENIFLTRDPRGRMLVKLLDFGIAEVPDCTGSYALCPLAGTVEYIAPEVLFGKQDLDCTADLYALGVVVFECLTGQCPFPGELDEVIARLRTGTPASLAEHRPDLDGALDEWMNRALHPQRSARFASAKELSAAFGRGVARMTQRIVPHATELVRKAA
jgi:serine/threonine-protein kinase